MNDDQTIKILMPDGSIALLLSIQQAADHYGYSRRYMRFLCDIGKQPAFKLSGRWFIIADYIESSQ